MIRISEFESEFLPYPMRMSVQLLKFHMNLRMSQKSIFIFKVRSSSTKKEFKESKSKRKSLSLFFNEKNIESERLVFSDFLREMLLKFFEPSQLFCTRPL